ncbi:MAG TPA: hypothetical protein VF602_08855 [Pedobacter sp.]
MPLGTVKTRLRKAISDLRLILVISRTFAIGQASSTF